MKKQYKLDQLCVNTIRTLSMDAVEKAKSGHPGMPMGMAPAAYILWTKFLQHNPKNPDWINRDRFILSAGHGSMLLYSLLYLTGYNLNLDDLKNFRQYNSKTPGHPEIEAIKGIETNTGPLGQGFANSVGMAIAEKHLEAVFNKDNCTIFDYHIYSIAGDGDLMEGITSEAASLAAHLKLGNLLVLYDNNGTTIEGETNLAFTEDVHKRFEAYGWQVLKIEDGNDLESITNAILKAKEDQLRPSLISIKTFIAFGSPNKQGKSSAHGSPLGEHEIFLTKKKLNWPEPEQSFYVPEEVLKAFRKSIETGKKLESEWKDRFDFYRKQYPEIFDKLNIYLNKVIPKNWESYVLELSGIEAISTREASGKILNMISKDIEFLLGGSADLAPSNNTYLKGWPDYQAGSYQGRNFHFGVREHAMGAIVNGIALSKMLIPYCATFLVFSDYLRPSIRLAALMQQQVVYVFTHDSIAVGEDGPTHQPVEHVTSLRIIPGLNVIRPADVSETIVAWKVALQSKSNPTALILTRQKLPVLDRNIYNSASGLEKGAYILSNSKIQSPDIILMASGSEVSLALSSNKILEEEGINVRVVSFPSWELFEKQSIEYKNLILPPDITKRLAIEAGVTTGWEQYVTDKGKVIGINEFGKSAPGSTLMNYFGFNIKNIVNQAKLLLK